MEKTEDSRVHLDRRVIEYAFCDVFTAGSQPRERKTKLKQDLFKAGKIIMGRKLKQVVNGFNETRRDAIHRYLHVRSSRFLMAEALLLTMPEFEETLHKYCASGYRKEVRTVDIAAAIRDPEVKKGNGPKLADVANGISVTISQSRLKSKDGRLFSVGDNEGLYLRFRKNPENRKEYFYWVRIESQGELKQEKTIAVVISATADLKTQKLLDDVAFASVSHEIETWNPFVSRAINAAPNVVDVFMLKASSGSHTRFYVEEGRLFTIYDQRPLAVEQVLDIVQG